MAYLGDFDATAIAPSDFSVLPSGVYKAIISNSEMKQSKSGDQYLSLTLQIVDGDHNGRLIWHSLNLNHANPQVVDIAQRELSAICHATGKLRIKDSAELHDIPLLIKLDYVPPKNDGKGGQWPEKNKIKKWEPLNVASKTPPTPATAARQAQTAAPRAAAPRASAPAAPAPVAPWKKAPAAPVVAESSDDNIPH